MVVKPKMRGFICTTAHPGGCAKNVESAAEYAEKHISGDGPRSVLVIGSSMGYGLSSRIAAAFGYGAASVGVFFERPASGSRTATAGWYNNAAFEELAKEKGLICEGINGDAFSEETKRLTIEVIKNKLPGGKVDLVVYSLGAPRRTDPATGEVWHSCLKPIGDKFSGKTVDFHAGNVSVTDIEPATDEEIDGTVHVMGGEDWLLWIEALNEAGVLADNVCTCAYNYIGPELTHKIYKNGTIGKAKEDLEAKARMIDDTLKPLGGRAYVAVLKGIVTQSSAAIPVVPLYISLIYKIMKEKGTHEDAIAQIARMFSDRLYTNGAVPVDERGQIRMDDLEMMPDVQSEVTRLWDAVNSDNVYELTDLKGYQHDFYSLFGFDVDGVDYEKDVEI